MHTKYIPADLECDDLLPNVTKIHCLSMNWGGEIKTTFSYDDMRKLVARKDITLVGHNFVCYDVPVLERLLGVKVECGVIDTLALSWYLYPSRSSHGLAGWGEEFGVPKPEIDDWKNLTPQQYQHRCEEDVKIQTLLWEKMQQDLTDLYDNNEALISSLMRYLSFKMYTVRLQEQNPFTLDVETTEKNLAYLEGLKEDKTDALKRVMPTVGVVSKRVPPKTPHKKDGGLSAQGEKWKKLTEERGLVFEHSEPIEVINNYDEPNPNSPAQIKDWLFSIGWKPENFNEGVNGKIPTYYLADKSLCPSVLKLGDDVKSLDDLGVLKHRIGLLKGFLRDQQGGYISCGIHGLASTLRTRHSRLVNMPKPSVPYGELIRGVLTCDEGYELVDSDLASLENMIKLDLIYPLNPDKVKAQLTEDFDSHLEICVLAGLMTQDDVDFYKEKKKNKDVGSDRFHDLDKKRHQGKTVNYSAQYGVGKKKLSETLDIRQSEAKKLLDAYWVANKEAKTVASRFETKQCLGKTWVKNPYNKFWYELRSEKDRLSAVIQSTGDFITHLWAKNVTDVSGCVSLIYHDELAMIVKKGYRKGIEKMLRDGIEKVNKQLKLHIPMDISINFGEKFSEIH
jgi:DNA polymerase III epsilon subunit-like protein